MGGNSVLVLDTVGTQFYTYAPTVHQILNFIKMKNRLRVLV